MKRFHAACIVASVVGGLAGGCANNGSPDQIAVRESALDSTAAIELKELTNSCGANQAQDFFQVINHGTTAVAVSDLSIKLWVDDTSASNLVAQINTGGCLLNAAGSCVHNVTGVTATAAKFSPACGPDPTEQANWEVTITSTDHTTLGPGLTWSNLQTALHLANFANFSPGTAAWYSGCLPGTSYADTPNAAVYLAGSLVRSSSGVPPSCRAPHGSQPLTGQIPPGVGPQTLVSSLPGSTPLSFTIGLPLSNQTGLQTFFQQLYDPKSPQYRKYLTPAGFGAAYGASQANYNAVVSFAQSSGLTVKTYPNLAQIQVSGTAANIERAFFVTLNVYKRGDGTTFYAPANQPSVNLSVPLLHLSGLQSYTQARAAVGGGGTGTTQCRAGNNPTPGTFVGNDFRNIYFPGCNLDGTGQTIGLFELDDYYDSDVARYKTEPGYFATPPSGSIVRVPVQTLAALPALSPVSPCPVDIPSEDFPSSCFQSALLASNDPSFNTLTDESEVTVDIDMVLGMAPNANIRVYEGIDELMILDAMANEADSVRPSVISSSYVWTNGMPDANVANVFLQFAVQGQSFFNDAGDTGAYVATGVTQFIWEPIIDTPLLTVVGGTELTTTPAGAFGSESVWNTSASGFQVCSVSQCRQDPGQACCRHASSGGICNGYTICTDTSTGLTIYEPPGFVTSGTIRCGASYLDLPIPGYQASMPSYLTSAASAAGQLSSTLRMIPDVSIVANNLYQFIAMAFASSLGSATIPPGDAQVFSAGGTCTQGTSASTPLWAGVALLANQQQAALSEPPVGFVNATLYALASASQASYGNFNDVTSGNNTYQGSGQAGFTAVAGYDMASGLGSPNGKSCSPLNVIPPQSCMAGNSLSALITGANVTAFMPNGSYSETLSPGISVVSIEGTGPTVQISTPGIVNTCGGNSQTGEVVCTANDLDIYLINGLANPPAITSTLASGASAASDEDSGGFCQTCNVAIDPLHNKAYVSVSTGTDPVPGAAFQALDLATGTLGTPIPANAQIATSEGILFDGLRGFVLSPNEGVQSQPNQPGDYQLLNTATGQVFDLINPLGAPGAAFGTVPPDVCDEGAVFDSAAEDCTTGIALSTLEFSDQLFLIDLTRATFNTTSSTWSAPNGYFVIPEFQMYLCNGNGAGTDGISIAPRTHLGIVAGEFGGHDFAAIQLPATAGGSGTAPPMPVDYAFSLLPATPDGNPWQAGRDPHTLTTYTSPTNQRTYAIMEDDFFQDGTRTYLAVIDLNAVLDPSVSVRGGVSPHSVATLSVCGGPGPNPTGTTPPGVPQCTVRYIPVGPVSVGPSGGATLPTLAP